jgi:predicted regulator of Ras-like GTPase activity (Roadblock/LC7/MglB family)
MSFSELVKAIFIFDKRSGRPFVRRTFGDFQAEPFLVMGFLNAIMKFSKEVGKSDLRMIDMQDLRFFFTEKNNVIFTSITNKIVSPLDLKFKIKTIESIFLERFSEEELADMSREIEYYESFIPIIDEIVFGDVRHVPKERRKHMLSILEALNQNDNIAGAAIISFTGILIADALTDAQRELFLNFFNGIYGIGISGITRVLVDTINLSIYITNLEGDCLLVVFSKTKRFQTADRQKISETILEINNLVD